MEEKYFKVKWKCGCVEYIRGTSLQEALFNSGYCADEECNIKDSVEATTLPNKNKEVVILNGDKSHFAEFMYNQHNPIADGIRQMVDERDPDFDGDVITLELDRSVYRYTIFIEPLRILCVFDGNKFIHKG